MKTRMMAYYAAAVIAVPLALPSIAAAQGIAVHDSAGLVQQLNTVRQAIQIVAQGKQQIAEAQKLYHDFNKLTDIPGLAQKLQTDALRQLDTSNTSLPGFANGDLNVVGAARTKADNVYRGLVAQLGVGGSDQSRAAFDLNARNIGIQAGLAENVGASVTSRAQGLDELRSRLATAGTAKEVADLTARLQLETAAMQNDQLRLQAIAMQQEAANRARAAAAQADLAKRRAAALAYYRGR